MWLSTNGCCNVIVAKSLKKNLNPSLGSDCYRTAWQAPEFSYCTLLKTLVRSPREIGDHLQPLKEPKCSGFVCEDRLFICFMSQGVGLLTRASIPRHHVICLPQWRKEWDPLIGQVAKSAQVILSNAWRQNCHFRKIWAANVMVCMRSNNYWVHTAGQRRDHHYHGQALHVLCAIFCEILHTREWS